MGEGKVPQAVQLPKLTGDHASKPCLTEADEGEEGETAELCGEVATKGHVGQHQCGDALPSATAGDTSPVAQGCVGRPVAAEEA